LSPVRDDVMGTVLQQTIYHCEQCGGTNIVAAPVVFREGTHTYTRRLSTETNQSFSALVAAPPRPRGYLRPFLIWGFGIFFAIFWAFAGLRALLANSESHAVLLRPLGLLTLVGCVCVAGMFRSLRRVAQYNRQVFPRLYWNWEHTYICKRCGRFQMLPS
jgi:hypothetical protein